MYLMYLKVIISLREPVVKDKASFSNGLERGNEVFSSETVCFRRFERCSRLWNVSSNQQRFRLRKKL
jgi:hypothetical protein